MTARARATRSSTPQPHIEGYPVSDRLTLDALNAMDKAGFAAALDGIFEHAPWVAEAAFAVHPFATVAALHEER